MTENAKASFRKQYKLVGKKEPNFSSNQFSTFRFMKGCSSYYHDIESKLLLKTLYAVYCLQGHKDSWVCPQRTVATGF